ncbi:MAG: glycosyltransferase family 4 protein [Oceanospirillaceae bacterium]|nr:glycosyltransferase family 4 protein [Oceanospirillaceae bacterium]
MKFLIITHAAGTPDIGPNQRTYFLGQWLSKRGHDVWIVGSAEFHKYNVKPAELYGDELNQRLNGVQYTWLKTRPYQRRNYEQVLNQFSFKNKLKGLSSRVKAYNPDVIITSSPPPFAVSIGLKWAKRCKAKHIFEIRDLWPEIIMELGGFSQKHPYISLIRQSIKKAYSNSDAIVSVKPGDLNHIRENYKTKAELKYIPNGFDHTEVLDEPYAIPSLSEGALKVVYVGALSNYYAIGSLIDAAKLLENKPVEILIVGDGDDREKYEQQTKSLNLSNVHFTGFLPKKNMLSIIRQCDVAFLGLKDTKANRYGISTNKLYEYMYAKKPIIASYSTDFDIVKSGNAGLSVKPESPIAIANALEEMLSMSPEERNVIGQNGYEYLMRNHTFEHISEEYLNLIDSLVK